MQISKKYLFFKITEEPFQGLINGLFSRKSKNNVIYVQKLTILS